MILLSPVQVQRGFFVMFGAEVGWWLFLSLIRSDEELPNLKLTTLFQRLVALAQILTILLNQPFSCRDRHWRSCAQCYISSKRG